METGEAQRAQQILQQAVTHDARDADIRVALAETFRRTGDLNEGIRMLETVRVQHPRAPRALLSLRELYREAGRWEEAAQAQAAYLGGLPQAARNGIEGERLADLQYRAALTHASPAARVETLTKILDQHRHHVPTVVALGEALVTAGRADEAVRLWERALRASPCIVIATRLFAQQTGARERQRLLASMAKVPGITPDVVHYFGARAALEEGSYDAAASELEQLSDRTIPIVQRMWAEVHRQRGAIREAIKALVAVADADPNAMGGFPCPVCQRIAEPPGTTVPLCKYWDGVRALGQD
jgi:tetratricopeptide (TPR) repeat protein